VSAWLGVASADHVARAVELGIAQIGHGKRGGLARLQAGEWLVYYSPRVGFAASEPLRAFTALGRVADAELYQADEGSFKPWRRRVDYERGASQVALGSLAERLELTQAPNWGYRLRRGLVELGAGDLELIRAAMMRR
jgi:hypothetical protein